MISCSREKNLYWQPDEIFPGMNSQGGVEENNTISLKKIPEETKIVIINFFAPGCMPCINELPDLTNIYNKIKDSSEVKFYAIGSSLNAIDNPEPLILSKIASEVYKFKNDYKIPYPVYLADTTKLKKFGVTGFPETFILIKENDQKWHVKRRYISSIKENDIFIYIK